MRPFITRDTFGVAAWRRRQRDFVDFVVRLGAVERGGGVSMMEPRGTHGYVECCTACSLSEPRAPRRGGSEARTARPQRFQHLFFWCGGSRSHLLRRGAYYLKYRGRR